MNIYVYNLPDRLQDKELESLFASYGEVLSARVQRDKESGRSNNMAYIHMPIAAQAQQAVAALNGLEVYGKKIVVLEEGSGNAFQM